MPRLGTDRLTPAEREVALLAAAGLSNSAIAGQRGRSANTIANQLAAACAKIGVAGRRELRATLGQAK
jgi:DNA-binding CsgD family transcriptional regulator